MCSAVSKRRNPCPNPAARDGLCAAHANRAALWDACDKFLASSLYEQYSRDLPHWVISHLTSERSSDRRRALRFVELCMVVASPEYRELTEADRRALTEGDVDTRWRAFEQLRFRGVLASQERVVPEPLAPEPPPVPRKKPGRLGPGKVTGAEEVFSYAEAREKLEEILKRRHVRSKARRQYLIPHELLDFDGDIAYGPSIVKGDGRVTLHWRETRGGRRVQVYEAGGTKAGQDMPLVSESLYQQMFECLKHLPGYTETCAHTGKPLKQALRTIADKLLKGEIEKIEEVRFRRFRERIAVFLDLENLVADYCKQGRWSDAARMLGEWVGKFASRGPIVEALACGEPKIAAQLRPKLEGFGVRTVAHPGGPNAADKKLLRYLRRVSSCDTVVIGSGDGDFAEAARELRQKNKRVELIYRKGKISAELYMSVDGSHELTSSGIEGERLGVKTSLRRRAQLIVLPLARLREWAGQVLSPLTPERIMALLVIPIAAGALTAGEYPPSSTETTTAAAAKVSQPLRVAAEISTASLHPQADKMPPTLRHQGTQRNLSPVVELKGDSTKERPVPAGASVGPVGIDCTPSETGPVMSILCALAPRS